MKYIIVLLLLLSSIGYTQKKIGFTYKFNVDSKDATLIHVTGKLINNSDKDMYFLAWSCNGINEQLKTTSPLAEVYPTFSCNASWPIKIELKAHELYEFKTIIKRNSRLKKVGLILDFLALTKTTSLDGKTTYEIRKENPDQSEMIKGPVLCID